MTPKQLVELVREQTRDWEYDVISLGYPGAVDEKGPRAEPGNLGTGWAGFDYGRAFGKPVRVIDDAVMQALGGYDGGRMLFVGLGTGLGSALITEHVVIPLELGCLPYGNSETMCDVVLASARGAGVTELIEGMVSGALNTVNPDPTKHVAPEVAGR